MWKEGGKVVFSESPEYHRTSLRTHLDFGCLLAAKVKERGSVALAAAAATLADPAPQSKL